MSTTSHQKKKSQKGLRSVLSLQLYIYNIVYTNRGKFMVFLKYLYHRIPFLVSILSSIFFRIYSLFTSAIKLTSHPSSIYIYTIIYISHSALEVIIHQKNKENSFLSLVRKCFISKSPNTLTGDLTSLILTSSRSPSTCAFLIIDCLDQSLFSLSATSAIQAVNLYFQVRALRKAKESVTSPRYM